MYEQNKIQLDRSTKVYITGLGLRALWLAPRLNTCWKSARMDLSGPTHVNTSRKKRGKVSLDDPQLLVAYCSKYKLTRKKCHMYSKTSQVLYL